MINIYHKVISNLKKQSLKGLPLVATVTDNKDLSKQVSGKPYRYPLAFFVPENRITSQVTDTDSMKPLNPITGLDRHTHAHSVPSYGGVTLQNKIANRRICRAVAYLTESEPRHPFNLSKLDLKSVVSTQNQVGGHKNA